MKLIKEILQLNENLNNGTIENISGQDYTIKLSSGKKIKAFTSIDARKLKVGTRVDLSKDYYANKKKYLWAITGVSNVNEQINNLKDLLW